MFIETWHEKVEKQGINDILFLWIFTRLKKTLDTFKNILRISNTFHDVVQIAKNQFVCFSKSITTVDTRYGSVIKKTQPCRYTETLTDQCLTQGSASLTDNLEGILTGQYFTKGFSTLLETSHRDPPHWLIAIHKESPYSPMHAFLGFIL